MCTREWNMLLPSVVMVDTVVIIVDRLIELQAATSEHFSSLANFVTRHHVVVINYVSPKFPYQGH